MTDIQPRPVVSQRGFWRTYGTLWVAAPGRVVYLIAAFVLAMVSLGLLAALFASGVGLLVLIVGLPLVVLSLLVARGFSVAVRGMLQLTALPAIAEPEWSQDPPSASGFWRVLTRPVRNAHYWLALVHGMIVAPIVTTITFAVTVTWVSGALGGPTYWFWAGFIPRDGHADWGVYVVDRMPWLFDGWSAWSAEALLSFLAGVVFALTLPWVVGGLAVVHHAIARGMLGRWQSDDLVAEVRAEAAARDAAVHAEDMSLRRLERDIHDGPQQRGMPPPRRISRASLGATPKRRWTSCVRCRAASRRRCCRIAGSWPR